MVVSVPAARISRRDRANETTKLVRSRMPTASLILSKYPECCRPHQAKERPMPGPRRPSTTCIQSGPGPDRRKETNSVLAYSPGGAAPEKQLTWYDRTGNWLSTVGDPADYSAPALSSDGKRLAVAIRDANTKTCDIWVLDLARGTASRLTFDPVEDIEPVWSPDARIAFQSNRCGLGSVRQECYWNWREEELLLESQSVKRLEA
jgi:hypothetical protein